MKKINFLVFIDDDNLTNRFHEIILKKADICEEYKFFNSGIKAMEFFKEEAKKDNPKKMPEYTFLDINMPNMDGWEFIEEYMSTSTLEPLNIIMLSTSTSIKDKNKAKEYEMVKDFMTKPLHIQRLKELVGKIN